MALEDGIREFATLLCFYRDMFLYQISKLMQSFNCPYKAERMWWPCAKSVELIINHMLGFFSYVFILFEVFVLSIVFQYLLIFLQLWCLLVAFQIMTSMLCKVCLQLFLAIRIHCILVIAYTFSVTERW